MTSTNASRAYYNAFSGRNDFPRHQYRWCDPSALETLRAKYNLPTSEELHLTHNTHYTSLYCIMNQCVRRAVHERGYKYGGTDYSAIVKRKEIQSKYPWLTNNPTKGGSK
jgi:hypothetical protein